MSLNNCSCTLPWDTDKTLKATFEFLKNKQLKEDGSTFTTRLYLGIASLSNITLENYKERNQAVNFIAGTIDTVFDHAVILSVPFECTISPFVVSYSDIQNLQNDALLEYKDEYINFINNLPPLCICNGNRYFDILTTIKKSKAENINNPNLNIVIMYAGTFSQVYKIKDLDIEKNLILVTFGIIPITSVMGYFLTPYVVENKKEEN